MAILDDINICSFNCRGLGDWHKRQFLSELLKTNCVDICLLQETHCYSKFIAKFLGEALGWEMFLVIW